MLPLNCHNVTVIVTYIVVYSGECVFLVHNDITIINKGYAEWKCCHSTPSLLKPIEAPRKYPHLQTSRPPMPSNYEFPSSMVNLTSFTYRVTGDGAGIGRPDREDEVLPITKFLASHCPNLRELRVKLFVGGFPYLPVEYYSSFTEIIAAKPSMETPRTFVALDVGEGLRNEIYQSRLGALLPGWEYLGRGVFRTVK